MFVLPSQNDKNGWLLQIRVERNSGEDPEASRPSPNTHYPATATDIVKMIQRVQIPAMAFIAAQTPMERVDIQRRSPKMKTRIMSLL